MQILTVNCEQKLTMAKCYHFLITVIHYYFLMFSLSFKCCCFFWVLLDPNPNPQRLNIRFKTLKCVKYLFKVTHQESSNK